ncbi:MAG: type III-B CRISPR module RAMP protein Cmr4 [Chloroflexi bacterium]|nr:MAG: type III-B CRISPR module RAMP protein Cmr4 [Chloroflexota bacterium]
MQIKRTVLYLYAESAIHAGAGTGLGAVDLPIQREKHTDYPIIQASGVKGALRSSITNLQNNAEFDKKCAEIFGDAPSGNSNSNNEDHASAISPGDARILLFPVRSLKGVFVWVTCPAVLMRFQKDTGLAHNYIIPVEERALTSDGELIVSSSIMLDEYAFDAAYSEDVAAWADFLAEQALPHDDYKDWRERLRTHLVLLPDDEFRDFVKYATEIVTRIHINDVTKTVANKALFTQELLPADSILYSQIHVTGVRKKPKDDSEDQSELENPQGVYKWLIKNLPGQTKSGMEQNIGFGRTQIGADETVGRGRVRLSWQEVPDDE